MPYYPIKEKSKHNHFRDNKHLRKVTAPLLTASGLSQPRLCFDISESPFSTTEFYLFIYLFFKESVFLAVNY